MRKYWLDTNENNGENYQFWEPTNLFDFPKYESGEIPLPAGVIEIDAAHPLRAGFDEVGFYVDADVGLNNLPVVLARSGAESTDIQDALDFQLENHWKNNELVLASEEINQHLDSYHSTVATEAQWRTYRNELRDYTTLIQPRPVRPS